jgi:hypothetical protein
VVAFAFQLAGVDVVTAMFTRVSVTGSVFLVVYGVAAIRKEGNEAKDLPNAIYPSPLRQLVFVSVARVSHWFLDAVIDTERGGMSGPSQNVRRHTLWNGIREAALLGDSESVG